MKKITAIFLTLILLCGLSTSAFSFEHYRFHDGHYYRHAGWFGLGALATGLAVGAYVASLPSHYETVYVNGAPYYYYDGYYYETGPGGYVVVDPPAGAEGQLPSSSGSSPLVYIIGTLVAILLMAGIALVVKKLLMHESKTA